MNKAKKHLEETRLTRQSARDVVRADVSYLKLMLRPEQIKHRAQEEAEAIANKAEALYEKNPKAVIAAGAGAALAGVLWAWAALRRKRYKDDVEKGLAVVGEESRHLEN